MDPKREWVVELKEDQKIKSLNNYLNKFIDSNQKLVFDLLSSKVSASANANVTQIKSWKIQIHWVELMNIIFNTKSDSFRDHYDNIDYTKKEISFAYALWDYYDALKHENKSDVIIKNAYIIKKLFVYDTTSSWPESKNPYESIIEISDAYIKDSEMT